MNLGKQFDFLKDPSLDPGMKRILLEGVFDEKRAKRDVELKATEAEESRVLENKKLRHNTPLILALVGTISVFANGLVTYFLAKGTLSNMVTLGQQKAQLKENDTSLEQQLKEQSLNADAKRLATKEERAFEYKLIEGELSKSKDPVERAEASLFLVRARIVTGLDRDQLKEMALEECQKAKKQCTTFGILETVGLFDLPVVGIDDVHFDKVVIIHDWESDNLPYTEVEEDGGRTVYVRERPGTLLRRLDERAFLNFTAPNGVLIWVKAAAIYEVRDSDNSYASSSKTLLHVLHIHPGIQAIREDVSTVVGRLAAIAPLVKLTAPNEKPVWLKAGAVSHISKNVFLDDFGGAASILEVNGRRIGVKEDVSSVQAILNTPAKVPY